MVCVSSLVWMTIGIGAAGGCGIVALLASSGVPLLGSLVWGGVFTAFFLMLVSPRPFRRLVGLTGVGGCAFGAGLAANGSASVLKAVAAGGLLGLCLLAILSLVFFTHAPWQVAAKNTTR